MEDVIITNDSLLANRAVEIAENVISDQSNVLLQDFTALDKLTQCALMGHIAEVKVRDYFKNQNVTVTEPTKINQLLLRTQKMYRKHPRFELTSDSLSGIKLIQETPENYKFYNAKIEINFRVLPMQEDMTKSENNDITKEMMFEELEKAGRDIGKLTRKEIVNKNGKKQVVYVKVKQADGKTNKTEQKPTKPAITKTTAFGKNYGQIVSFKYKGEKEKTSSKRVGIFLGQDENGNRHFIDLGKAKTKIGRFMNKVKNLPKIIKFQNTLKNLQSKYKDSGMKTDELYQKIYQDFKEKHAGKYEYRTFKARKMRKSVAEFFLEYEPFEKAKYDYADANFYYYRQPGGSMKKVPKSHRMKQKKEKEEKKGKHKELHKFFDGVIRASESGDPNKKATAVKKLNDFAKEIGQSKEDIVKKFKVYRDQYKQDLPKAQNLPRISFAHASAGAKKDKAMGEFKQIYSNFKKYIVAHNKNDKSGKAEALKNIQELAAKNQIPNEIVTKKFKEYQNKFEGQKKALTKEIKRRAKKQGVSQEDIIKQLKAHIEAKNTKIYSSKRGTAKIFNAANISGKLKSMNKSDNSLSDDAKKKLALDYIKKNKIKDKQLKMGISVEMEHTDDPAKAEIIAKDHLKEIEDYYTWLVNMEKKAKKVNFRGKLRKSFSYFFRKARQNKYIKREKRANGKWKYWYADDAKAKSKPKKEKKYDGSDLFSTEEKRMLDNAEFKEVKVDLSKPPYNRAKKEKKYDGSDLFSDDEKKMIANESIKEVKIPDEVFNNRPKWIQDIRDRREKQKKIKDSKQSQKLSDTETKQKFKQILMNYVGYDDEEASDTVESIKIPKNAKNVNDSIKQISNMSGTTGDDDLVDIMNEVAIGMVKFPNQINLNPIFEKLFDSSVLGGNPDYRFDENEDNPFGRIREQLFSFAILHDKSNYKNYNLSDKSVSNLINYVSTQGWGHGAQVPLEILFEQKNFQKVLKSLPEKRKQIFMKEMTHIFDLVNKIRGDAGAYKSTPKFVKVFKAYLEKTKSIKKSETGTNTWISKKIKKLMKEGYEQKQAVAIAMSMYKKRKKTDMKKSAIEESQVLGIEARLKVLGNYVNRYKTLVYATPTDIEGLKVYNKTTNKVQELLWDLKNALQRNIEELIRYSGDDLASIDKLSDYQYKCSQYSEKISQISNYKYETMKKIRGNDY